MTRSTEPSLKQRFLSHLRRSSLLVPGDSVGVAVSGGADSVALLRLLISLQDELGIALRVVHFHHSLRAAESDADAEFVAALARAHRLEFLSERRDVGAIAKENRWNLEDTARRLRYSFFEQLAATGRVTRAAVAHTADDQAETVLAHIFRGTGLRGLAGIHPVSGCVVRPLLAFRRSELRVYLESIRQAWREDSSNLDTSRTRARIRSRLLPFLESDFSPAVVEHLCNLARFSREEETFWDAMAEVCFRESVRSVPGGFSIRAADLLAPPPYSMLANIPHERNLHSSLPLSPLTERLIRRLYQQVRGDRPGLTALHVDHVVSLAEDNSSGHFLQLPHGVEVERNFDDILFRSPRASAGTEREAAGSNQLASGAREYEYSVELPGRGEASVSVPEIGTCFKLKVVDWPLPQRETKGDNAALDADLLLAPLVLRSWRPGDAYRPCGRRRPRKLKQLFLARRVPVAKRAGWPVLESAGRVVWARGFPPAADFSTRRETRAGVLIVESQA
ncbi:MAG TPA: tRNA lysidine(34) synthetase TilS [Candidatus Acidoferrum sp.]|nr:tRNA lysidine(34) synthetase TilS [Candidatus Acidoferrum sp.]